MCVRSCGCSHMWQHNQSTNENGESITVSFPANAVLLILLKKKANIKVTAETLQGKWTPLTSMHACTHI